MKRQIIFLISLLVLLAGACVNDQSGRDDKEEIAEEAKPTISEDTTNIMRPPVYFIPFEERFSGGGFFALIDGKYGGMDYTEGFWQGFNERDLDVAIDLGKQKQVTSVSVNCLKKHEGWIFLPKSISILASNDLKEFRPVGELIPGIPESMEEDEIVTLTINNLDVNARYIRIKASSIGAVPAWVEKAKGRPSWFFIDEIVIE